MTKKIFTGIMLMSGLAVLIAILFVTGIIYRHYSERAAAELCSKGRLIAAAVEQQGESYLDNTDFDELRVTWISPEGRVIFDSEEDPDTLGDHSDRIEIHKALESGEGGSSRYSSTIMQKTINYAKRINDGSVIRVSDVHMSAAALMASTADNVVLIFAAIALLSALGAVLVSRNIVRPVNNIDLDHPDISRNYKELAPLLTKLRLQNGRVSRQLDELTRSRRQFSIITENMDSGLIIADSKTAILAINSSAWRLLGSTQPADGASIFALDHSDTFRRCIQDAMGGKRSECILSTSGGDREILASPAKSTGMINGIVVFIHDVTEKQQLEIMRREFTSNVSHELKTPLTTIYGISDMLANGIVKPEDISSFGCDIRNEADRLITLINDIVSLSKLDENSIPRQDTDVDLYELAQEIIARLAPNAQAKQVTGQLTGEHITLRCNRTVIDEIIYNLCDNAIKYNTDGGSFEVRVSHIPTKALITVSDNGPGIPAEHLSRIFERFYRVDKSRSRKVKGTGLGLSIVKHGVMYLGGTVRAESTPGSGTVFTVELPIDKQA